MNEMLHEIHIMEKCVFLKSIIHSQMIKFSVNYGVNFVARYLECVRLVLIVSYFQTVPISGWNAETTFDFGIGIEANNFKLEVFRQYKTDHPLVVMNLYIEACITPKGNSLCYA